MNAPSDELPELLRRMAPTAPSPHASLRQRIERSVDTLPPPVLARRPSWLGRMAAGLGLVLLGGVAATVFLALRVPVSSAPLPLTIGPGGEVSFATLGLVLDCRDCAVTVDGQQVEWQVPGPLRVTAVRPQSRAAAAGVHPGDLLVSDGATAAAPGAPDLARLAKGGDALSLRIQRGGDLMRIALSEDGERIVIVNRQQVVTRDRSPSVLDRIWSLWR